VKNFIYIFILIFSIGIGSEIIKFESANPFSFQDIILYLDNQDEQIVYGRLELPTNVKKEQYPLIIGVAGSLGWSSHHFDYLKMYREMGIATFQLQSFKSRDIESTVGTQDEVTIAAIVLDSYRALDVLSQHPKIDENNIAITGWSLGGGVSLFSGWKPVIKAINPKNNFAAHLPIYPPCFVKPKSIDFVTVPIHILIGELDTWTPADACVELIDMYNLNSNHKNIGITIYENSHHSFDSDLPETIIENGYSFTDCMFTLSEDGVPLMNILDIPMSTPSLQKLGFSFCASRGPIVAGNSVAKEKAFKFAQSFMSKYLLDYE